ncbi:MAG: peptidase domain-containing ABC transporter [Crocinitomicaceae bacterium]
MSKKFKFHRQLNQMDCGPTCIKMIAGYYGKNVSIKELRTISETNREGSSLLNLANCAEHIGFKTLGVKLSFEDILKENPPLPLILHWNKVHFVVLVKATKKQVTIADPAQGIIKYSVKEFIQNWIGNNANEDTEEGIALLLEPTPQLKSFKAEKEEKKNNMSFLFRYITQYKGFLAQLSIGLLIGSVLQLILPFLTQSLVDVGIQNQDINFIYLILIAQISLFLGQTTVNIIRSWILLHMSTRINISLVSDFFIKLMKLPISYFDSKMTGDILQRINDHQRIENLLTNSTLNTLFSFVNLVIFGAVLIWYDVRIFGVFLLGSILYFAWIVIFLKKREILDHKKFQQLSGEQSKVIELINGMQEIKLNNAERQKRWGWEYTQARLFHISKSALALEQTQTIGSSVINELKNIAISILAAMMVIRGEITLGMMMSITYIIGQTNGPISQLINFMYTYQDAKIALKRLGEIHDHEEEEDPEMDYVSEVDLGADLVAQDISFRYKGTDQNVINGMTFCIPANRTTAIVGASGSGKTTLMKILMKFYEPDAGDIKIGVDSLDHVSHTYWRANTGVVMQEGHIFNDTIAANIAIGQDSIDKKRLIQACEIACIRDFIEELPLNYNTKIGMEGVGLSGGQKQRILIARAVYKNPQLIFFDEATSSLDAVNEAKIMENLNQFIKDRTAVIIAHRLSTVKTADQILVLDKGRIIEQGNHFSLVESGGKYYELVKNQLELERLA